MGLAPTAMAMGITESILRADFGTTRAGCDTVQGYPYAPPLAAPEAPKSPSPGFFHQAE